MQTLGQLLTDIKKKKIVRKAEREIQTSRKESREYEIIKKKVGKEAQKAGKSRKQK